MIFSKTINVCMVFLLFSCSLNTENLELNIKKSKDILHDKAIKNESNVLELKTLLNNKVSLLLPIEFNLMAEETKKVKYPSSREQFVAYTNENGAINFTFNHTQNLLGEEQMAKMLDVIEKQFTNLYSSIQWIEKKISFINNKEFIILEFKTSAIDTEIYNLMYITSLKGRMLINTFNCIKSEKSKWKGIAKECLNSIKVID